MVDPKPVALRKRQHPIVPPRIRPRPRLGQPESVHQSPGGNPAERGPGIGVTKDTLPPLLGASDVTIVRSHVEVTGQHQRLVGSIGPPKMAFEPGHPFELVTPLLAPDLLPVREVGRHDPDALDRRRNQASLVIGTVVGHPDRDIDGFIPGQDGDPVVGPLAEDRGSISGGLQFGHRKVGIGNLELLEADDIGIGSAQPVEESGQPGANRIDVPGGEFHTGRVDGSGPGVNRYIPNAPAPYGLRCQDCYRS